MKFGDFLVLTKRVIFSEPEIVPSLMLNLRFGGCGGKLNGYVVDGVVVINETTRHHARGSLHGPREVATMSLLQFICCDAEDSSPEPLQRPTIHGKIFKKSGSLLANKWTLKTFELIHKGRCAATPLRTTICHFSHCAAMPLSHLRCALCVIGCASGGRHHLASSRHKMKIDSYLSIEPMEPIRQAGARVVSTSHSSIGTVEPLHTDSTSHSTVWSGSYAA